MFLDIQVLERRKIAFDERYRPGRIDFVGTEWKQVDDLHVKGEAELIDKEGSRTLRVRGHIRGRVRGTCGKCLEEFSQTLDSDFDFFYYPMSRIAVREEIPVSRQDVNIGFYEGMGLELTDVVKEQSLLTLPMSARCRPECKGICPQCGADLNQGQCSCSQEFADPRWDALKNLHFKN